MKTRHRLRVPNDRAFPSYPEVDAGAEGPLVTAGRLQKAKWQARHIFNERLDLSQSAFRKYAQRKYRCKARQVCFDDRGAMRRIRDAVISYKNLNHLGETDGVQIRITGMPMTDELLVGTLIHEGMHNWCSVRGRFMSCENEHFCMTKVGEIF